eukprot:scaffold88110_cov53-Phaeocystis_antarctica.AAC.2
MGAPTHPLATATGLDALVRRQNRKLSKPVGINITRRVSTPSGSNGRGPDEGGDIHTNAIDNYQYIHPASTVLFDSPVQSPPSPRRTQK